jgi:hypothetical protein
MTSLQLSAGVRAAADLLSTDEIVRRLIDLNGRANRPSNTPSSQHSGGAKQCGSWTPTRYEHDTRWPHSWRRSSGPMHP